MSSRKLDFKTWCNDIGIRECDQTTKCDDCKAAWDFAEAQEKRENEELKIKFSEATKTYTDDIDELQKKVKELEKEGFTLSANQCCAEDCGIHFEEGTSLFCKHEQENETLKKRLSEAVEVIKFYARKDLWKELEIKDGQGWEKALIITSHRDQEVIGNTELIGGKRARAFLKGDEDE